MSFVYTATATGTPVLQTTCPADTDPRNAASVCVPLQGLADDVSRIAHGGMSHATLLRSFAHFEYTAGVVNAWIRYRSSISTYTSHWAQSATDADSSVGDTILWGVLDLPHGANFASVQLHVASNDAARVVLPDVMPSITVYEIHLSTGVATVLGTGTDGSADVATYKAPHTIVANVAPAHVIDRTTCTYLVAISGEHGANSNIGFCVFGGVAVMTSESHDQGAG